LNLLDGLKAKNSKPKNSLTYKEKANKFSLAIKEGGKERNTSKNSLHKITACKEKSLEKYLKGHAVLCVSVVG
jgi:hypothetical protein